MGLGLGEVSEKGAAEGQQLDSRERLREVRMGAGISRSAGSPLNPSKAVMRGHQARASSSMELGVGWEQRP